MKHPILSGSGYKLYTLIWFVVIAVHSTVLYFYYDFSVAVALIDSIVFNVIFGAIVPGFWFIVIFGGLNKDELSLILTHAGAAGITIVLWILSSSFLLRVFFRSSEVYIDFLNNSLVWRMIIGVLFYSISVLIFYLIRYYQDMQKRLNRELELQNLLKDTELRMLKSQINPHFIFNSLNSISALTTIKPDDARSMVIKLSDFLRYSLGKDHSELTSIEREVANLMLYLDIEKIRFGDKLQFKADIADDCKQLMVPNLILQPLIENAIKYGMYESLAGVVISLSCTTEHGMAVLRIKNSFDGSSSIKKGEGIGLQNVRKRLFLVFERNDLLSVHEDNEFFTVTIQLPINE